MSIIETIGYKRIKESSLAFVNQMKLGDQIGIYRKETGEGESFYGSYHALHIVDLFGDLKKLSDVEKSKWAENFQKRQTQHGYFSPQENDFSKRVSIKDMEPYWHYTRGNIWALRLLNIKSNYKLNFLEPLLHPENLYKWVKSYDWSNPWAAGNQVLACATALFALRDWFDMPGIDKLLEEAMYPALEELMDEQTGFWGTQYGADYRNGLFGTIHLVPIYFAQQWPLSSVERKIDSTLKCQSADGSFWPGGSDCPDFDGAYMIANLSMLSDYRKEDLKKAARKYLEHALMHEDPAGKGWLLHRRGSDPREWKPRPHWIWKKGVKEPVAELREENLNRTHIMLGSWFYPLSIALISRMLGDTGYEGPYHFSKESLHVCNVPSLIPKTDY